ncbi:MAG: peptidoglycan DD-metalloendopeptidase family protein [Pseudomonadota bacterium]
MLCATAMLAGDADLVDATRSAINRVEAATLELEAADGARQRVLALTQAVQSFEAGLAAVRDGSRRLAAREAEILRDISMQDAEIAALLAALQSFSVRPAPSLLMHPGGPAGSLRAGLLLSDVAPTLDAETARLRQDLERIETFSALRKDATQHLETGLAELQLARQTLSAAVANRQPLPKRFSNDPVREAILLGSVQSLTDFARGLDRVVVDLEAPASAVFSGEKGAVPLPVAGTIVQRPGTGATARPGWALVTPPGAVVTSPVAATVRYAGPLLDMGQVIILEPQANVLFVFAGLQTIYVSAGDILLDGAPVGLMGGNAEKNGDGRSTDGDDAGVNRSETLYIEVRKDNQPENPGQWFQTEQDG